MFKRNLLPAVVLAVFFSLGLNCSSGGGDKLFGDADAEASDMEEAACVQPAFAAKHPTLVADKSDKSRLKTLYDNNDEFAAQMIAKLKGTADNGDPGSSVTEGYDPYRAVSMALIAKNAAFMNWLGLSAADGAESYPAKAKRLLLSFDADLSSITLESDMLDIATIHGAEAIIGFLEAFDFLSDGCDLTEAEYSAIRGRLLELVRSYYDAYFDRLAYALSLWQNNHAIKAASAIGTASLLFPDEPDASKWRDHALSVVDRYGLVHQACEGGSWAEGPAYFQYAMLNLRAYGLSLHRLQKGAPASYNRICAGLPKDCVEEPAQIDDVLFDSRLRKVSDEWMRGIFLPEGWAANIDDADYVAYNFYFDAFLTKSPKALWYAEKNADKFPDAAFDGIETLLLYDETLSPQEPENKSVFFPGIVKLTNGALDGLAAWLIGEKGRGREAGMGHEQPDNQSFIMYYGAQPWIIDSGYIAYSKRKAVALDVNHNVILVDGKGGPTDYYQMYGTDDDADLTVFDDSIAVPNALSRLLRNKTEISRALILLNSSSAMIIDRMVPQDGAAHEYKLLFHLNAGGSTTGTLALKDDGAVISRGSKKMRLKFYSDLPLGTAATDEMTHSFVRKAKDDVQEKHLRLTLPIKGDASHPSALVCSLMNFYDAAESENAADGYSVKFVGAGETPQFCFAAAAQDDGKTVNVYLWQEPTTSPKSYALTDSEGNELKKFSSDAVLTGLKIDELKSVSYVSGLVSKGTVADAK